jgi:hypothetical protein
MQREGVQVFLEDYYARSYNNSGAQTRILQAQTRQASEHSARQLLKLLSRDLPLVANPFEIARIFAPFNDSLAMASKLYPELLEYSHITEYKEPIISMLSSLVLEEKINPHRYKKYLPALLSDANMQLKRQLGQENQSRAQSGNYNKNSRKQRKLLEDYTIILFPYRTQKELQPFFRRLYEVKDPDIRTTYVTLLAIHKGYIPNGFIDSLVKDINSRCLLYNKLQSVSKSYLIPEKYASQQALAEAMVFEDERFDPLTDTIQYVDERPVFHSGKTYKAYYFKHKSERDFNKNFKMVMLVYPSESEAGTKPVYQSKGLRMEDTDTDEDAMHFVTEEYLLKDHPRAIVFEPTEKAVPGFGF